MSQIALTYEVNTGTDCPASRALSHAMDDGHIDKKEQKMIDEAHERQLLARGRGKAQLKPYRTGKWIKNGIKSRLMPNHTKSRERESGSRGRRRTEGS